jgi:hypothetical protein
MKKNSLLTLAILTGKLLLVFNVLMFLILTYFLIHVQVSPERYAGKKFSVMRTAESALTYSRTEHWGHAKPTVANTIAMSEVTRTSLYFNYVQLTAILVLIFIIIQEFLSVIRSVRSVETFRGSNVKAFRKMGLWLFLLFLASGFSSISTEFMNHQTIYFRITPLILMLLSYVMAEIFKEGNELSEENQLTI